MAKGFGKGFVTGVAGTSCCCRRCGLHIQEKSNRTRRTKSSFHRRKPQKAARHPCLTLIIQKLRATGAFAEKKSPFWKISSFGRVCHDMLTQVMLKELE